MSEQLPNEETCRSSSAPKLKLNNRSNSIYLFPKQPAFLGNSLRVDLFCAIYPLMHKELHIKVPYLQGVREKN